MAELKIFKNHQLLRTLQLTPELVAKGSLKAGRSPACEIPLDPDPGISREHFEMRLEGGLWIVHNLSRYSLLKQHGESREQIPLTAGTSFDLGAYHFEFVAEVVESPSVEDSDKTRVGLLTVVPYLRVLDASGRPVQVLKLEGENWIAGRDPSCALFIDNAKFSRQHFEISKQDSQYFVRDLESSNGTSLNGQTLSSTDWTPLRSSDVLRVVDWQLVFELRDPSFQERVNSADQEWLNLPVVSSEGFPTDFVVAESRPHSTKASAKWDIKNLNKEQKKLVLYGGIGAVVLIFALMFSGESPPPPTQSPAGKEMSAFDKLSPEQKTYVQQSHQLAQRLVMQGKYELARQELIKIHQLVPKYEDSKQLEEMTESAIKTVRERELLEAKERERLEAEAKVLAQAKLCEQKMNSSTTQADLEACLGSVLSLAPDHPELQRLRGLVDKAETERNMREAMRIEKQEQIARLRALFQKAVKLEESGQLPDARKAYSQVAQSELPDPGGLKAQAQAKVAEMVAAQKKREGELAQQAEGFVQKNKLKEAILAYQELNKLSPGNSAVEEKLSAVQKEHRKLMQNLYQEAVLEESIGEVPAAQAKWKKVLEQSYPEEEYYQKSQSKLRKYGG